MEWVIFEKLLRGLIRGRYAPGELMPSENHLAQVHGVPRLSVRRAYEVLEQLGYLKPRKGLGRIVRESRVPLVLNLRGEESFTEKMAARGLPVNTSTLYCKRVRPRRAVSELLELGEGPALKLTRLRTLGAVPLALHISYLDPRRFPDLLEKGPLIESLFAYFRTRGHRHFRSAPSRMSVTFPTGPEAELLGCPSLVPLVLVETGTLDDDSAQPLQYTKILYRSDLFTYEL